MSNTDSNIVRSIGNRIKEYRTLTNPLLRRMDFYIDISDSEDVVNKIESGKNMASFHFLVQLSKKTNHPIDKFCCSGMRKYHSTEKIIELLSDMSTDNQYQFLLELDYLKYSLLTDVDSEKLDKISIFEPEPKLFGKILHNERMKRHLSMKDMASLCDRSETTLARMEHGGGRTSPYIWVKISTIFHIPMDVFLFNRVRDLKPNMDKILEYLIRDIFADLDDNEFRYMYDTLLVYLKKYIPLEQRQHQKRQD